MTLSMVAVGPVSAWYGQIDSDEDVPIWVEVHATPTVDYTGDVNPGAGAVSAGTSLMVGFMTSPIQRLVTFVGDPPEGVSPLSDPFPTGPGFTLRWGEAESLEVSEFLPWRWDEDGEPVDDPRP